MLIFHQLQQQLQMLHRLLQQINIEQYTYKSRYLTNATIGAHTRHIIEILQCTIGGLATQQVDYVNRQRNLDIETNPPLAIQSIEQLINFLPETDAQLHLINDDGTVLSTTYFRELVYNTEHIIHHLALIKVSLTEMGITINDAHFGFAYATIKFQQSQLQNN